MRTTTFETIGHAVTNNTILEGGLPKEMCFKVEKRPLGFMKDNGEFQRVKGKSTVVSEFGKSYGAVSDNYNAIDNPTALGSLAYIDGMNLVKYGETNTGMQYIIGKLEGIEILGDNYTPYLIFRNSFDGRYPIQATICPLRIVCQNQFNIAFKNATNQMNIRHTKTASSKLEEAQRILLNTSEYLKVLGTEAEKYATTHISEVETLNVIRDLFPIKDTMTDRQKATVNDKIAQFEQALRTDDNANFRGTMWGIINAYADFVTHETPKRQTETQAENKFMVVTFDPRIMAKLLNRLAAVA